MKIMTEKAIRQDISAAEKNASRLEKQHGKLQRLAASTADRLAKINEDGDPSDLMEARIRRDTAREMLAENERDQAAAHERIEELKAQAEKASLVEQAAHALSELEAAKSEWKKTATAAARTFLAAMEDLEAKHARVSDAYRQASAAAHAATGNPDGEGINANVTWAGLPGVSGVGMIETENMSLQPPMFKAQWAAIAQGIRTPAAPRVRSSGYA